MIKQQKEFDKILGEPAIGRRVQIEIDGQRFLTSPVQSFRETVVTGEMRIETKNTIYYRSGNK